jgi:hypothetical protein
MSEDHLIKNPDDRSGAPARSKFQRVADLAKLRGPWLAALVLFAVGYFGSYCRYGITFRDEGGSFPLLAKRLLEGQRPFLDVELKYNVLWFYPVVLLFKLGGVSFVLLRAYCFALSTIAAVLGFFTIERVSRRAWLAFLVGALLVLVPGMTFKNYMPLLAVANIFCLVHFALARQSLGGAPDEAAGDRRAWRWIIVGGILLGLTFLIRVDLGIFVTVLWLGGMVIDGFGPPKSRGARWKQIIAGPLLLFVIVGLVHAPVLIDAQRRGFAKPFADQYLQWPRSIALRFSDLIHPRVETPQPAARPAVASPNRTAPQAKPAAPLATPASQETLHRQSWTTADKRSKQLLFLLLYAPFAALIPLLLWSLSSGVEAARKSDAAGFQRALAALLALGGALIDFPQYFFFRPDAPHLSEFSPGFWVAAVASVALLGGAPGSPSGWRLWAGRLLSIWLGLHAAVYLWRMLPDPFTGTIAARTKRTQPFHHGKGKRVELFHGANGVDVYLTKSEFAGLTALVKVIREHTAPGDYLLVYPYHPAINLIVDLPTYETDLYVDNDTSRRTKLDWQTGAIERIQRFQPAVIVLSDWAINGNDASRFSVWGARTKAWIQAHYDFQGLYTDSDKFEVYTLRPKGASSSSSASSPTPARTHPSRPSSKS